MRWSQAIVKRLAAVLIAGSVAGQALGADAAELELLLDRQDGSIELYAAARADTLLDAFGLPHARLTNDQGFVHFADLREGTFDIGDELIARTGATLDGAKIPFEALSLMVHPIALALPITTPLEALIAVGVCSVDDPATPPGLADLQGYVGFIAYVENTAGAITLDLPETGLGPVDVTIREFRDGTEIGRHEMAVGSDGVIRIPAEKRRVPLFAWILVGLGGTLVGRRLVQQNRQPGRG
ncbi:MAG: hypothetical protein AAGD13_13830 [Pseudomonadota bacterium]